MQLNKGLSLLFILFSLLMWHCTPKTTDAAKATETTPKPAAKPAKPDDPCAKFSDSRMGEAALDAHVIYRDYIRMKDFESAIPLWRRSFAVAPAADGKRRTHFEDGIRIYDYLMEKVSEKEKKKVYLDSIIYMLDRMDMCYGDAPGYKDARIAFNLYYKYRDLVTDREIYKHFTTAVDAFGLETPAFVVNPFTALLVEMYQKDKLAQDEAVRYAKKILQITEQNRDNEEEGWPIVLNYAPARLEVFETVKGFFDCNYYEAKYFPDFEASPTDCDVIETVLSRLKWGGCEDQNPQVMALRTAYTENCRVVTTGPLRKAKDFLEEGEYDKAIEQYQSYVENQEDNELKAKYLLRIAKIYYAHLKDFPKSRQFARSALEYRPDWGEPYLLIGKLYASSGPLCGPGRGWDSQVVTWPAVDKFIRAKSVDPSVTQEANKWIATYSKYMPSNEDIFQRQLQEGASFRVGCWIQENTTIRPARK